MAEFVDIGEAVYIQLSDSVRFKIQKNELDGRRGVDVRLEAFMPKSGQYARTKRGLYAPIENWKKIVTVLTDLLKSEDDLAE